jgi:hypothetical protein
MRSPSPLDPRTVLGVVKARPGIAEQDVTSPRRPALTAPPRGAVDDARGRDAGTASARTKELHEMRSTR